MGSLFGIVGITYWTSRFIMIIQKTRRKAQRESWRSYFSLGLSLGPTIWLAVVSSFQLHTISRAEIWIPASSLRSCKQYMWKRGQVKHRSNHPTSLMKWVLAPISLLWNVFPTGECRQEGQFLQKSTLMVLRREVLINNVTANNLSMTKVPRFVKDIL